MQSSLQGQRLKPVRGYELANDRKRPPKGIHEVGSASIKDLEAQRRITPFAPSCYFKFRRNSWYLTMERLYRLAAEPVHTTNHAHNRFERTRDAGRGIAGGREHDAHPAGQIDLVWDDGRGQTGEDLGY